MGKNRDLSSEQRAQILALRNVAGLCMRKIATELGVTKSSVCQVTTMAGTTQISQSKRQGNENARKTSLREDRMIQRESLRNRFATSTALQRHGSTAKAITA